MTLPASSVSRWKCCKESSLLCVCFFVCLFFTCWLRLEMGSALLLSHLGTWNLFLVFVLFYCVHFCVIICLCLLSMMRKALFWQQVVMGQGPTRPLQNRFLVWSTLGEMVQVFALGMLWQLTALRSSHSDWPELQDASSASSMHVGCREIRDLCSFSAWHEPNPRLHYCPFVKALKTLMMSCPVWMP